MRPQTEGPWRKTIRREMHRARVRHKRVKAAAENLPSTLRAMSEQSIGELADTLDYDTAASLWRALTVRMDAEFEQDHQETASELARAFVPPF